MRGIGQGQTITLMVIPEMSTMIRDCLRAAGSSNMGLVESGCLASHLEFVAAWLIVNGLKSEQTQVLLTQKTFSCTSQTLFPPAHPVHPAAPIVVVVMVVI